MDFRDFQEKAKTTAQYDICSLQGEVAAVLGLVGEAGSVATIYKKWLRDSINPEDSKAFIKQELGDVLWYASAIATARGLDLDEIAKENLERTRSLFLAKDEQTNTVAYAISDASFPEQERFPRRVEFRFAQSAVSGVNRAVVFITNAVPNAFPQGAYEKGGKNYGFDIGRAIGDRVDDNSRRDDGYRFHDAVHIAFMAVLGWSPVMRKLLQVKRRSCELTDRVEDGARARDIEEGLSAVLARLSKRRQLFLNAASIDTDVLEIVSSLTAGLEVQAIPHWCWRSAINQGFRAMYQLDQNGGGRLVADLDKGLLEVSKI